MVKSIAQFMNENWMALAPPLIVLAVTLAIGLVIERYLFRTMRKWAARTRSQADDLVIESLSGPCRIWILMLGLYLAAQSSTALSTRITDLVGKILLVLWIVSLTLVASRLVARLVKSYGSQVNSALPVTSLSQNLARMAVVSIGVLVLLNVFGISITPILTALGVGGLAVALALQDTLSNLFAGFYISVANQVRIGDYIKLESGGEGYVSDITWRSTTIRMLSNNLIIIPNAKLAQAIVTNYHLPERRMSVSIPIGVSYDSDPDHIERVLVEEAKLGAGVIPGLLTEPEPFVRFSPGFGASSLDFTLICQVGEFVDQYLVQHELRKRIFKRFRREGIEIPFPVRTVVFKGQGAEPSTPVAPAEFVNS